MRFKDVFSIIGPSMVGPSSSHTAGALRIGRTARRLFGTQPEAAEIVLYGSFAETYMGHGTDLALAAGLLDFETDDMRIRDALRLAELSGMNVTFGKGKGPFAHPNTVRLTLSGGGRQDAIVGASIGGGNIEMTDVNGFDVKFTVRTPTLFVFHGDRPGIVAEVTGLLGREGVNIGYMDVDRKSRRGDALTVIETDEAVSAALQDTIRGMKDVTRVGLVDLTAGGGA
ncbi:L-serine ammonia-lyase, iron-sulfur-dependent subunit beta [Paenibacillus arenilitoris]|uniref:L-serine deaminase n=1 Tax=Paenibacillus arenilitoris TaxID=2772299 RepID=A0A927CKA6_9BACL|nr:L-serine ammonia-lyase, iron-sulfur-dependent subunit beta [Paenibacillus arenilitoris]MBD2868722.1 L-serine ammonia-lyase, iron-sulfur-dependent, subunit beta [Paenibacillus arenilitoris]